MLSTEKGEGVSLHPTARLHGAGTLEAITASLKRFGQAEPLVVQAGTGMVLAGNGRMDAMKVLGWDECDVVELDVTGLDAAALGIALNRTAELAEWDNPALTALLEQLRAEDSLDGVGYSSGDIDNLLDELQASLGGTGDTDLDAIPEPGPWGSVAPLPTVTRRPSRRQLKHDGAGLAGRESEAKRGRGTGGRRVTPTGSDVV